MRMLQRRNYGWLENCTGLEELTILCLNEISMAFCKNAVNLKSIELPSNTTKIEDNSFSNCSSLSTIIIGDKLSSIGKDAFSDCNKITSIYCKAKVPPTYSTGFSKDVYLNCNLYRPFETEEIYKQKTPWNNFWNISESTDCVSEFVYDDLIYSVINNENVTLIGNDSYELRIPESVEYYSKSYKVIGISDNAFKNTTKLSSIVIPNSIIYIGNGVFNSCTRLKSMTFEYGENTLTLGHNSSLRLSSTIVPHPNPSTVDDARTGFLNGYYEGLLENLPIEHLVINRNIELPKYFERTIGDKTSKYTTVFNDIVYYPPFYGLHNLKSIEIGKNVNSICKNEIEIYANAIPATMYYRNFDDCDSIEVIISNNPNAPIGGGFSQNVYENATLFLPNGGQESYRNDEYWKYFTHVSETSFVPIESISFDVDELIIDINESRTIHHIINPENASIKTLKWHSSNPDIVNVSDDGKITASNRNGEAIITATACDGTEISTSMKVIVQEGAGISNINSDTSIDILVKDGKVYITGKSDDEKVNIYNIHGQLIKSVIESEIEIDTHGMYIINIGSTNRKVII